MSEPRALSVFPMKYFPNIYEDICYIWFPIKYFLNIYEGIYPAGARSAPAGPKGRKAPKAPERPRRPSRRASAQAVTLKWQLRATSPMNTSSSAGENGFSAKNGS